MGEKGNLEAARSVASAYSPRTEVALVDRVVDGSASIPLERVIDDDGLVGSVRSDRHYQPSDLGDMNIRIEGATWWRATIAVSRGDVRRRLTIPGRTVDAFLDAVDDGALTEQLESALVGQDVVRPMRRRR